MMDSVRLLSIIYVSLKLYCAVVLYTKTVIVDADAGNYRRKLIVFFAGLGFCGGHYDTPRHPLF